MDKKSILFFLPSSHFNDAEFFTVKKILEENGIFIFVASDSNIICQSLNGQKVKADVSLFNIHESNFSGIVLVGGAGARRYWDNVQLHRIVDKFNKAKKVVAAICSAPVTLAKAGILKGKSATCFFEDKTELISAGIDYKDVPVVVHGNIITANGTNASKSFADAILRLIL